MAFVRDDLDGLSYEQVCELADELAGAGSEVDASERSEFDAYCREVGALRARLRPAPAAVETEAPKRGDHWPKEIGARRERKKIALQNLATEQADERARLEQARKDAYKQADRDFRAALHEIEQARDDAHGQADRQLEDGLRGLDKRVSEVEIEHDTLILQAKEAELRSM
jgi:hypothetical protein